MKPTLLLCHSLLLIGTAAAAPLAVRDTKEAKSETTGVTILSGSVDLPRKGGWAADSIYRDQDGLTEIYLQYPEDEEGLDGERSAKLKDRAATQQRGGKLRSIYWSLRRHAQDGDGFAPDTLDGLKLDVAPIGGEPTTGIHLIPKVRMFKPDGDNLKKDGTPRMIRVEDSTPLLIDLTPAIDDGKHWVYDNRGNSTREDIDVEKMKALGLTIKAQAKSHLERLNPSANITYAIFARRSGPAVVSTFTVANLAQKTTLELTWDTRKPAAGDESILSQWAETRLDYLYPYLNPDAAALPHWAASMSDQYKLEHDYHDEFFANEDRNPRRNPRRTANAMNVIGGRSAIRETLQLQDLTTDEKKDDTPSIAIADIPGVEVKAHPFEEMLGDEPGGALPLADWIPHDHFLLYLPKPEGLFDLVDSSSAFLFASGTTVTGRSGSHGIKDRYLDSFGVSEQLMRRFLDTGAIKEIAATVPDLFLIDGTEISVVLRTGRPLLTTAALALVGVPPGDGTTIKKNRHGEPVHWVRKGDILIISTHQKEVDAILAAKADGTGLGQSAELRYMLTQVPLTPETVVYTYFSDPFIRHLVGPGTKIGQLRRLHARGELEGTSAGALLARFDGHAADATDLGFLAEHDYLRPARTASDLTLADTMVSSSETFGTPARMHSLTRNPAALASPRERDAYGVYLENYNRFWRAFFDPIAIRYEQKDDGQHALETFILPLIDNSLYSGIRTFVLPAEAKTPLLVPVMTPEPIATLSVNLNNDAWLGMIENFADTLTETLGIDGAVLDLLGPDIHVAIHDADPIISIGNGELSGLFNTFGGAGNSEMFGISAAISMLTRPSTIHVGLSDPDEVRRILTNSAGFMGDHNSILDFGNGSLAKVTGKDKWIYTISIEGIITLRYGIEVQDRYLVVSNLPFSNQVKVTGSAPASNNTAALGLNPAACVLQRPALYSSAAEANSAAARSGAANLMPFIMSGADSPTSAQDQHAAIFGFTPTHPAGGTWTWDATESELTSSLYDSVWSNSQPEFDPDQHGIGVLQGVSHADCAMQFEQDGLRTTVTWKTR